MFSERSWLNERTNLQSSITKFSLRGIDCGKLENIRVEEEMRLPSRVTETQRTRRKGTRTRPEGAVYLIREKVIKWAPRSWNFIMHPPPPSSLCALFILYFTLRTNLYCIFFLIRGLPCKKSQII